MSSRAPTAPHNIGDTQQPVVVYNVQRDNYRQKFVYQLLFFALTTLVGLWVAAYAPLADLLATPEEKEQQQLARDAIKDLVASQILTRDRAASLTQHELRIAARIVDPRTLKHGFDDIGGLADMKRKIYANILVPMRNHDYFFMSDNPLYPMPVRGVLFSGPSGCGKTMTARAIAKEAGVKFINITLSDINDKYHGESERLLSAVFSLAMKVAPCIIFIDEMDGMIGERSSFDQSHVYGLKTHFLSLMDGLSDHAAPIMVVGCTNNPVHMDKAMRRRMPLVVEFALPTPEDRFAILGRIAQRDTIVEADALAKTAQLSEGFSGSDLENVYREACMHRMAQLVEGRRTDTRLQQADLDAGLEATARSMDAHRANHLSRGRS